MGASSPLFRPGDIYSRNRLPFLRTPLAPYGCCNYRTEGPRRDVGIRIVVRQMVIPVAFRLMRSYQRGAASQCFGTSQATSTEISVTPPMPDAPTIWRAQKFRHESLAAQAQLCRTPHGNIVTQLASVFSPDVGIGNSSLNSAHAACTWPDAVTCVVDIDRRARWPRLPATGVRSTRGPRTSPVETVHPFAYTVKSCK